MTRQNLYKAVKYEAHEFFADHGMNMSELWAIVTGKVRKVQDTYITAEMRMFWIKMCVEDYKRYLQEV